MSFPVAPAASGGPYTIHCVILYAVYTVQSIQLEGGCIVYIIYPIVYTIYPIHGVQSLCIVTVTVYSINSTEFIVCTVRNLKLLCMVEVLYDFL